jgi:hypothetical protein
VASILHSVIRPVIRAVIRPIIREILRARVRVRARDRPPDRVRPRGYSGVQIRAGVRVRLRTELRAEVRREVRVAVRVRVRSETRVRLPRHPVFSPRNSPLSFISVVVARGDRDAALALGLGGAPGMLFGAATWRGSAYARAPGAGALAGTAPGGKQFPRLVFARVSCIAVSNPGDAARDAESDR